MPRLALDPDQASRFQCSECLFTDGPGDPEAITKSLADGYGPAPHCGPGADGAGEEITDRMGSLAGHGPLLRDRAEKKQPAPFPLGAAPPHFAKLRRVDPDRRDQMVGQRRQVATRKWYYSTICFHRYSCR